MLVLLAVGTYFAPAIIGLTPLGAWVAQRALKLDGTISWDSASLGWFSSVSIDNLQIRDAAGEPMIDVASVRTDKSLVALALDFNDLGPIHVDHPVVHVVARARDTNLEQSFAELLAGGKSGPAIGAQLEITGGSVIIADVPTSTQVSVDNLEVQCTLPGGDGELLLTASAPPATSNSPATSRSTSGCPTRRNTDCRSPTASCRARPTTFRSS